MQFAMTSLNKLQLKNVDVKGKRVFIRVDFNVPQDKKDPSVPLLPSPFPTSLHARAASVAWACTRFKHPRQVAVASCIGAA